MKMINAVVALAAFAWLPLASQALPSSSSPSSVQEVRKEPGKAAVETLTCLTKGCPKLDQNGNPPLSCSYTSGMATGWRCILICAYKQSNWGTTVDSSNCD